MSDKHPAKVLADRRVGAALNGTLGYWAAETDQMLRRIPALEAERDRIMAAMIAAGPLIERLVHAEAERDNLRAEVEALRADAERYRWLLANYARGDGYTDIDAALNDGSADEQLSPAIDAARGAT